MIVCWLALDGAKVGEGSPMRPAEGQPYGTTGMSHVFGMPSCVRAAAPTIALRHDQFACSSRLETEELDRHDVDPNDNGDSEGSLDDPEDGLQSRADQPQRTSEYTSEHHPADPTRSSFALCHWE